MVVIILIGVPMWWKTTEVYRVSLPSSSILELSDSSIEIGMKIHLFTFDSKRSEILIQELKEYFETKNIWKIQFESITQIENVHESKTANELEEKILQKYPVKPGNCILIEWPKLEEEILLTVDRTILFKTGINALKIKNILILAVLQTHRIQSILHEDKRLATKNSAPQPHYDVIVSVLNSRPDAMDVKWNVQKATETYIAPFLNEVNQISNFTLRTQWKYQVPFDFHLKQVRDDTKQGRHYALPEETLPHIITSFEKNLGYGITDHPAINMIIYIPPCDIAPLHIYKRNEQLATHNDVDSFISPKWGGIIIHNPPVESCLIHHETLEKITFNVNTTDVMQIMLYHLHKLLDISSDISIDKVGIADLERLAPRKWEYEAFIRRSCISHIVTASHTLQSLVQLLDRINYIVINDAVGEAINKSYKNILKAKELLKNNDLINASIYAKNAFISSEEAFFDPSLLAQLYFPDEQKYAIYIPLFLPIMVPVLSSISIVKTYFVSKTKTE